MYRTEHITTLLVNTKTFTYIHQLYTQLTHNKFNYIHCLIAYVCIVYSAIPPQCPRYANFPYETTGYGSGILSLGSHHLHLLNKL